MKKIVMGVAVAIMAVSIGLSSAEAKRMGSGGSVGKQSQSVNQSAPSQSAQSPAAMQSANPARPGAAPAAAAPKPASAWKGMLGGALLGLGLGALLSSMGIGGALASMISTMLMVGLLVMAGLFIYRMVRSKSQGGQDNAGLFSNDDTLAERLAAAGKATGEGVWRMPLGPTYDKIIDSKFADVKN